MIPFRLRSAFLLFVLVATFMSATSAHPLPSIPDATTGRQQVYWGVWIDGVPWDMTKLEQFESTVGKGVSIVHYGQAWQKGGQLQSFYPNVIEKIRQHGAIPMINWSSWDRHGGVDQPDFRLQEIYNGRYDAYLTKWARAAKAWGNPFFLKFNHEMNGNWSYPWAEQLNGNQPGDYVKAWRHVHTIFQREGATNVTWVWCPNHVTSFSTPLQSLYPGDAYVDWTCLHGYNWGGRNWLTFTQLFRGVSWNPYDSYQQVLDIAPSKPMMLGEWASTEAGDGGAKKAAWIRDALQTQIPLHFKQVRAVVWFNWNERSGVDWVVESSQASIDAFASSIASPIYPSNQFSTLSASPIRPMAQYIWIPTVYR